MPLILQYLLSGLGVFVALSYAYGQWRQGQNQEQLDTGNLYKDRIEALELKVKTQDDDIVKLTAEVHKLRLENEEKNKKLLEALEILQGRNPEIADFIKTAQAYILLSTPTIERMGKYLDRQSF